ncbi:MAG: hypothetical protein H0X37_24210 [Herpetosiphonaceae bacterium]|nr:hypothetical protein [Herpetosiphonaceae bacterium]
MTGEFLGRLVGAILVPFIVMALVGAVYYRVTRPRFTFRQAVLRWWVILIGVVIFLLGVCGQLGNAVSSTRR